LGTIFAFLLHLKPEAAGRGGAFLVELENVLQCKLQLAVIDSGIGYLSPDTRAQRNIWGAKLGVIEGVQGFRAESR
jgi:hypothetical protein